MFVLRGIFYVGNYDDDERFCEIFYYVLSCVFFFVKLVVLFLKMEEVQNLCCYLIISFIITKNVIFVMNLQVMFYIYFNIFYKVQFIVYYVAKYIVTTQQQIDCCFTFQKYFCEFYISLQSFFANWQSTISELVIIL
eukprot:TRINITY_DN2834_c0_g1_i3.p4 TRINITY_DN2834_c0_g1~~TRINITY_DN2834_c0_g1_i3.p4  ORF type:complete len:137 (-),score=7.01 TRINITY_DN2834_c0_g1_i3:222-632(-)